MQFFLFGMFLCAQMLASRQDLENVWTPITTADVAFSGQDTQLQGCRRWVGRLGNCPPIFGQNWYIRNPGLTFSGFLFIVCLTRFQVLPTALMYLKCHVYRRHHTVLKESAKMYFHVIFSSFLNLRLLMYILVKVTYFQKGTSHKHWIRASLMRIIWQKSATL